MYINIKPDAIHYQLNQYNLHIIILQKFPQRLPVAFAEMFNKRLMLSNLHFNSTQQLLPLVGTSVLCQELTLWRTRQGVTESEACHLFWKRNCPQMMEVFISLKVGCFNTPPACGGVNMAEQKWNCSTQAFVLF